MNDDPPALRYENVSLRLGGRLVVSDFSLTVGAGEKVTLTGPSGGGKSSLLRAAMGFTAPSSGDVHLFGERLTPSNVFAARRRLAWVPQEPDLGDGAAREAAMRPLRFRANARLYPDREAAERRLAELFEALGLPPHRLDARIGNLSGGEKQRLAIAAALLLRRALLLIDEASSALDEENRDRVAGLLRGLEGVAVLSVSHDPAKFAVGERVERLAPEQREPQAEKGS